VNPAAPYDTCATQSCQVYGGVPAEKPATDAAVTATRAQVVAFGSKAASTYFSSDSGGFTASSAEVWGSEVPYLTARPDPFSAGGPRARWRLEVPLSQVQAVAAQYGVQVGPLSSVTVTRLSASGRPAEILLVGASGASRLGGAKAGGFIRSLGASGTRVTLAGLNPLVIEGSGAGHGVGLSQYGALGLARAGYDHLHVLGFYYPGTVLGTLSAPAAQLPATRGLALSPALGAPVPVAGPGPSGSRRAGRPAGSRRNARRMIRIPFVSPTIRNFTGLPAPRPEPVFLSLCGAALRVASARTQRAWQPIQSESV
jgi:stage II sporulation protein D